MSNAAGVQPRCVLLPYATRDGQARLIAARLAGALGRQGLPAALHDLADPLPAHRLAEARAVGLVLAVRYGRHLPEGRRFLAANRAALQARPLVVVSVNLTARRPGRTSAEGNVYLRRLLARYRLHPAEALAVAGRLDYPRYTWLDRQMIRLIMLVSGGPTDAEASIEYTDWAAVDGLAGRMAELVRRPQ
jgi:menaquinone-dependent protoporphyrinogen oxidase